MIYQHYAQTGELPSANAVASALERGFAMPTVPFVWRLTLGRRCCPAHLPEKALKLQFSPHIMYVNTYFRALILSVFLPLPLPTP
jgi:hypothetical protein